jgi:hypothetical protein
MKIPIKISEFHKYFEISDEERPARKADHEYKSLISNLIYYYYYIRNDIYEWFKTLNIAYYVNFDIDEKLQLTFWYIEIPNDSEAVLFKLTWM